MKDVKKLVKDILPSVKLFLVWRIGLLVVAFLAGRWLPFRPSFPYWDSILSNLSSSQFIWQWANFDGPHYITIAEKGYVGTGLIQAFFPLYPLTIRWFSKIFDNYLYSGLIISNLVFVFALYYFRQLIKLEKIKESKFTLLSLLLFPTSFYFGALYSESLFFLFVILCFLGLYKKQWFKAVLFASLASATRLVGIFLAPAILYEYYQSREKREKSKIILYLKSIFLTLLSISGFMLFCFYLNKHFSDPFFFAQVQSGFGASRQTDKLILFHQVVWRYLKMMFTIKGNGALFFTITQEFFISLLVLGLLIWGVIKKIKKPYLIYSFGSFLLPTLTGNLSSMPRYISLIFPLYFILDGIKNKWLKLVILVVSGTLLVINTALFVRGFWIA